MFLKSLVLFSIVALAAATSSSDLSSYDLNQVEKETSDAVKKYLERRNELSVDDDLIDFLPDAVKEVIPHLKKRLVGSKTHMPKATDGVTCSACVGGLNTLIPLVRSGLISQKVARETAVSACVLVLERVICEGAVDNYLPELWYIIKEGRSELDGGLACATLLGGKCGKWESAHTWTVEIPEGKPEVIKPTLPEAGSPVSKILHLTDLHLDLGYKVGSQAQCGRPMCCSNDTEMAVGDEEAAGYWGSYECDVPTWTFEDMLLHIRENHFDEIEYIMMTGDNPPHDVWLQSREGNLDHTRKVVELINKVFPDKQIIYTLGNHESFPCNSFPPVDLDSPEFNPSWFYEAVAEIYSDWLPGNTKRSMQQYGHYSFLIKPGFRIIVVNSNPCLSYNFWTLYQREDMNGELAWLAAELLSAEAAGELVHIINHVPPGDSSCLAAWGREFNKIVDRFENTIRAQFYGHTHNDEFIVFYDAKTNSRPTNIGHLTPSVSTYTGYNMGYRLYTMDGFYPGNSLRVLDHETYIFNLESANYYGKEKRPQYYKLYEAKKTFGLNSLFPEDYDQLARRMATDDDFFLLYLRLFNKGGHGEDGADRREITCSMVTTSNTDDRKCIEIMGEP